MRTPTLLLLFLYLFLQALSAQTYSSFFDISGTYAVDAGIGISWTESGDFFMTTRQLCDFPVPNTRCIRVFHLDAETGTSDWHYDYEAPEQVSYYNSNTNLDVLSTVQPGVFQTLMWETVPDSNYDAFTRLLFSSEGLLERRFVLQDSTLEWIREWGRTVDGRYTWSERPDEAVVYRDLGPEGEILTEYVHERPGGRVAYGDVFPLPDGGYLYTYKYEEGPDQETTWGRRGADGTIIWERDDNEPTSLEFSAGINRILLTNDSTVVLSEYLDDRAPPTEVEDPLTDWGGDYLVRAFDFETGEELWYHVFTHTPRLAIVKIIPAANGDIIGLGFRSVLELENEEEDYYEVGFMFRFTSSGELLWDRNYTQREMVEFVHPFTDVVELPDGRIAVTGVAWNRRADGSPNADAWLLVVDENGCLEPGCGQDILVSTRQAVGPPEPSAFALFPNPATGVLQVTSNAEAGPMEVNIYALDGRLLKSERLTGSGTIDVKGLPRGLVMVRLLLGDRVETFQIILQ